VALALGGYLISVGGRYHKVTMFMAGLVFTCGAILVVLFGLVFPNNSPMWSVGLSAIVGLGMGAGVGWGA
jgi:hypothetical protein